MGKRVPHHTTRGLEALPTGSRAAENGLYAYFRSERSQLDYWNTISSIFERWRGPKMSRGPRKLPPSPLSTGLNTVCETGGLDCHVQSGGLFVLAELWLLQQNKMATNNEHQHVTRKLQIASLKSLASIMTSVI